MAYGSLAYLFDLTGPCYPIRGLGASSVGSTALHGQPPCDTLASQPVSCLYTGTVWGQDPACMAFEQPGSNRSAGAW